MKKYSILIGVFVALTLIMILAFSAQLHAEETVKCAVSGKEMKKSEAKASHEYKGNTYYFCCEGCKKAFLENPEKYTNTSGNAPAEHTCTCQEHGEEHAEHDADEVVDPVCGMKFKKADAKATYEYNGKTYYYCMEGCKEKFVKEPGKYVRADDNTVKCPVSGETFNKSDNTDSMEYQGKTYYFCCPNCLEKFKENPDKYIK